MSNNEKRNGEIVAAAAAAAGQISNVLTTGTSTPALVAQALSGKTIPDQEGSLAATLPTMIRSMYICGGYREI